MTGSIRTLALSLTLMGGALVGCQDQVTTIPNSDPDLNKSIEAFQADAAKRFPFPADLPSGGTANARAQVAYDTDLLQLLNLSAEDWTGVELWVNRSYVVYIPTIAGGADRVRSIHFKMLYDANGGQFPSKNDVPARMIRKLEIVRDAQIYEVPVRPAD